MFPVIEYIKTCLNGVRQRIEKVEKSISQAFALVKAQLADIIQAIKNVRIESAEAIKSSTADWGQNDSNALDYVKNRTHYMLPATPIGSLEFTATATDTIEYTMTEAEEEFAIFKYFQALNNKGEVLKVIVGGKEGLLAVTFDRGNFGFSGVFTGSVYWRAGNVLSLVAQNDFITFNQGDTYTVSFEDTTTPYYSKLDFNYMPDNVYHSENAPVKFGAGANSTVQGDGTTATGNNAHAEGRGSAASESNAHAEGIYTVASGYGAHAEGDNTQAGGDGSHAEGYGSNASGYYTHTEGDHTVANRRGMHAEGKYNLYDSAKYVDVVGLGNRYSWSDMYAASEYTFDADTGYYTLVNAELKNEAVIGLYYVSSKMYASGTINQLEKPISLISGNNYTTEKHLGTLGTDAQGKYVHVVGNGISSARSNAYTLDWDGNGWFAGDVFVGGKSQDEGVKLLKAGEAIPIPQTASVGQAVVVKAVDENGKPTEWEVVEIPSGGGGSFGGSGKAKSQILIDQEITELTASLSVTLEHDFHNLTAIISCGTDGVALTAGSDGTAVASKIGLLIDTTSFDYNSRKVAFIDTSTGTWRTMMFGAEWSDDLSVFKRSFAAEITTNTGNKSYVFPFGGIFAMYGTLGTDDNAPRTGKTANIVVNGAYLNIGTRVVLWGEYYE